MSKYEAVYFMGNNQVINRVRVDSSKTRNRGAFSRSLAALVMCGVTFQNIKLYKPKCFGESLSYRWSHFYVD